MSRLLVDEEYSYRGYHGLAVCRLRIYGRTTSPLVIATELPENTGTSITNMAEYLAWEVDSRLLVGRFEYEDPFDWVEHYPGTPGGIKAFREDHYSLVIFEDFKPRVRWMGGVRRVHIGQPTWKHVERAHVEDMLGLSLGASAPADDERC